MDRQSLFQQMNRLTLAVALFSLLSLGVQPVRASGIGVTNGSLLTTNGTEDTGLREWVELTGSNGLLSGRPKHPYFELITVYAPGIRTGHLILRELRRSPYQQSVQLTAAASLASKIQRATLYIKSSSSSPVMLQAIGENWERRYPQAFVAETEPARIDHKSELFAFPVDGLGSFWLFEDESQMRVDGSTVIEQPTAQLLLGGSIERALLPLVSAVILLVMFWVASVCLHRMDRYANK